LNLERTREKKCEQEFFYYTKQWYNEFIEIRESHRDRVLKLYAETEDGSTMPVTHFVEPIRAERILDSPYHAARFVSLIQFDRGHSFDSGGQVRFPVKSIYQK